MKKRLTINRVAGAGLRANKRGYLSLAAGIMLSILLISTLCLCVQGIILAEEAKVHARVGYGEIFVFDSETPDSEVLETGWFDRMGHIDLRARVSAYSDAYLGCYDEEGLALMNRTAEEGRLPEKAGEIAIEQWQLDLLTADAQLGDSIELELLPIDGRIEKRTYTLVGVLSDQAMQLATHEAVASTDINYLPSLIVHSSDDAFSTGRTVHHQVLTLSGKRSQYNIMKDEFASPGKLRGVVLGMNHSGRLVWYPDPLDVLNANFGLTITVMTMLIGALLLACCVGIAGAMEGQLLRKTEEIGMLRAVGATRKQIRSIFGRESWLIALIVSPLSVGLACGIAWACARIWPEQIVFRPSWQILIPILLLSMLMILLSSSLPLCRASKIMPMSVIRDTATLRKAKRVKSRMNFKPARLISGRQLRLHPGRLIAPAVLIALMMFILVFALTFLKEMFSGIYTGAPEFMLDRYDYSPWAFSDIMNERPLSDGDLNQLRNLESVESVSVRRKFHINLLLDEPVPYLTPTELSFHTNNDHLRDGFENSSDAIAQRVVQSLTGTDKLFAQMDLMIVELDDPRFNPVLSQGRIDADALNSGREVLVYAPDYFCKRFNDGGASITKNAVPLMQYDEIIRNDYFTPDMTLDLMQLWLPESMNDPLGDVPETEAEYRALYAQCERNDARVTVGAVFTVMNESEDLALWAPTIVTTEAGARAMGLCIDRVEEIDIRLSETPDAELEARLEKRITQIGYRSGMDTDNYLEMRRESAASAKQMLAAFGGVAVVFLAISVGLITGNISRSIRADVRKLGTLRAVGADGRVLAGCYRGQIFLSIGIGVILALVGLTAMEIFQIISFSGMKMQVLILYVGGELVFLAIALCACLLILSRRISEITKQSIIENIREL